MRVFVTGATGFVGTAVVRDLLEAGHEVLGLARSDKGAAALAAAGAEVHRGDLEDLESLRRGAAQAEGVIHTAFNHDFSKYLENCEADRRVIEAIGGVLAGSDRPLIVTSGIGILPPGGVVTEETMPPTGALAHARAASEQAADAVAALGVRVSVVRLPPSVHGAGDHGFVPILVGIARDKGVSAYPCEGENRWPAVQRLDAARLYRLALEQDGTGARYHAVAEQGVPFREIAGVIGRRLGLPVESRPADHFGWFARFAAMDVLATARLTQERLGWQATGPGLIADIDRHYFEG